MTITERRLSGNHVVYICVIVLDTLLEFLALSEKKHFDEYSVELCNRAPYICPFMMGRS